MSVEHRPETVGEQPDGDMYYRTDQHGTLVGVLPAHCRRGHDLFQAGYRATEADGMLRIFCLACRAAHEPDRAWALRTSGHAPKRAELDDVPYAELGAQLGTEAPSR